MPTSNDLMRDILAAVASLPTAPGAISNGEVPRLLPAGGGGAFQISKDIDQLISKLASELRSSRSSLDRAVSAREWRSWTRSAIGPEIAAALRSTPCHSEAEVLTRLAAKLDTQIASLATQEFAFGATVFVDGNIPAISLGPVTFEPRLTWLSRKHADRSVSSVTERRLRALWSRRKLEKRKVSSDSLLEDDIRDAVGPSQFVCSVVLSGYASEAGENTAAALARLGLCSIALLWQLPSDAMQQMRLNWDGSVYSRRPLSFRSGYRSLGGFSLQGNPFGVSISATDWAAVLTRSGSFLAAAGEVLSFYADRSGGGARPSLMNALAQSMIWFLAGCREESAQMATVYFNASLDALGKGRKAKGILTVLEARLGIKSSDPINSGGPTFAATVNTIYSDGRSRTIHGTSDRVGHDWSRDRALAEELARLLLVQCLGWAGSTPSATEADDLRR